MSRTVPDKPVRIFNICDLYPYEAAAVEPCVVRYENAIEVGDKLDPVEIIEVNHELVVSNGVNRVFALKRKGRETVEGFMREISQQELRPFKDALSSAQKRARRGFENFSALSNEESRQQLRRQEEKEDYGSSIG